MSFADKSQGILVPTTNHLLDDNDGGVAKRPDGPEEYLCPVPAPAVT